MNDSERESALTSLMGQAVALQVCIKHLLAEHFRQQPNPADSSDQFFDAQSKGAGDADFQERRSTANAVYEATHLTLAIIRQQVHEQLRR
jgi:hypothetical protein